jgi:hypothetical protein
MYPFFTPTIKFTFNFIFKLFSLIDVLLKKVVIPPFDRYFKVPLPSLFATEEEQLIGFSLNLVMGEI